jgi:hypothetical protein
MLTDLVALIAASIFVGAALYINLVEQPARMTLDDRAMVGEWTPSDRRGFAFLATLSLIAAVFAVAAFHSNGDVRWLVGGAIILAIWPYTFFVLVPLNNRLLTIGREQAGSEARLLVRDWGLLEWGQTALGAVAASVFAWALT